MRLLPLALLLLACSPPPDFVSTCLTSVYGTQGDFIERYNAFEARALATYNANIHEPGFDAPSLCRTLSRYSVEVVHKPDGTERGCWWDPYVKKQVCGLTFCDEKHILIGGTDFRLSALAHEFAHAAEDCADPDHSTWQARGIFDTIGDIQNPGAVVHYGP